MKWTLELENGLVHSDMHGQYCEESSNQWHMLPAPSQRPSWGTVTDFCGGNSFLKDGRKINIGDCALFQAGNIPPFIGIIRTLTTNKEGNLTVRVNWLYRPVDVKLAKGVPVEAAPNEIFYSFHRDDISASSLLHPCKIAFLPKGVELPPGVSSFVCRRVYDISTKCLWWLTDRDYADQEHQEEVDQLLDKTKHEMQAAVQSGVLSPRALTGPASSQQPKATSDNMQNASLSAQEKNKKRERTDQSSDPSKRERSLKSDGGDAGHIIHELCLNPEELSGLIDNDGGLINLPSVDQLVQIMQQERSECVKKIGDVLPRRTMLASVIGATQIEECLDRFVQLGGLPMLDDWLQEAHKGKAGDGGSPKESDKGLEDLLLVLLHALDKLPVDLDALKACTVGKSVNNLRSHKNMEIQKKARKLVETWKKRVDAEMKMSSGESKTSSTAMSWSCKQSSADPPDTHAVMAVVIPEATLKSTTDVMPMINGSCPGDSATKSGCNPVAGGKLLSSNICSKENHAKVHLNGTNGVPSMSVKEEKSSSSSHSQSNSQSWSSATAKPTGSMRKAKVINSVVASASAKIGSSTTRGHNSAGMSHLSSSTGTQKELAASKLQVRIKSGVQEKVPNSGSAERGSSDSLQADMLNNQRLIVQLPNAGQSPALDLPASTSRGSSPSLPERQDIDDCRKIRTHNLIQPTHSPEASTDGKSRNTGTLVLDCGVNKLSTAGAEYGDCRLSDAEFRLNVEADEGKKGTPATGVVTASMETGADGLEAPQTNIDEVGIDLLASVAANESSETGIGVGIDSVEGPNTSVGYQNREPNQTTMPTDMDSLNITGTLHGEDGKERHLLNCSIDQCTTLERTCMEEIVGHLGASSAQGIEDRGRCVVESAPTYTDRATAKNTSRTSTRQEDFFGNSSDGCENTQGMNDTSTVEKGTRSGSSLTGEQIEGLENDSSAAEGSEDGKQVDTSAGILLPKVEPGSGYDEEDALEVARQVAKEVEQEVEQYGKTDQQDLKLAAFSKNKKRPEAVLLDNQKNTWCFTSETDVTLKGEDADCSHLHCVDDLTYSDDSQETVTERREDTETERTTGAGESEEVDQSLGTSRSSGRSKLGIDSILGSVVDAYGEERNMISGKDYGCNFPVSSPQHVIKSTSCSVHISEDTGPQPAVMLSISNDGDMNNAPSRPSFDLNEGLVLEEDLPETSLLDDGAASMGFPANPAIPFPHSVSAPVPASNGLTAPIAVVATMNGAVIPPSNLLRWKGEPGWKGSAATSAFRPAEPRRTPEPQQSSVETLTGDTVSVANRKRSQPLDIDLNVADERVLEDGVVNAMRSDIFGPGLPVESSLASQIGTTFPKDPNPTWLANSNCTAPRQQLDLNRVEETEDNTSLLILDSRSTEALVSKRSSNSHRVIREFDLNDGPLLEDGTRVEPPVQALMVRSLGSPTLPAFAGVKSASEVVNVASWFSPGNSLSTLAMPTFSSARPEPPYAVGAATVNSVPNARSLFNFFNGDVYRAGAVMPLSSGVSYSTTMPPAFSYTGTPFGSNFPLTSTSFVTSSTHYQDSSASASFPAAPSPVVSAGPVSPYIRPYLMGVTEDSGVDGAAPWSRLNLDLNAGPDQIDIDSREGISRQPSSVSPFLFAQTGTQGKRKEPEGGCDPFKPGFKQMWR